MIWHNRDGTIAKTWEDAEAEAQLELAIPEGSEPEFELLRAVARDRRQDLGTRIRCATAILPYLRPKLSVAGHTDHRGMGNWMEEMHREHRKLKTIDAGVVPPPRPNQGYGDWVREREKLAREKAEPKPDGA